MKGRNLRRGAAAERQMNQVDRNLRQLRDEVERRRLEDEMKSLESQGREAAPPPAAGEPPFRRAPSASGSMP